MVDARANVPIGQPLRALREGRQITLEDMSRATRIGVGQLEALEADDFRALPAAVFVKGFIRSYCQFLGEPADEALERYRALLGEPPVDHAALAAPRRSTRSASPILVSALLLVVFGGGLVALTVFVRRERGASVPVTAQPAPTAQPPATVQPPAAPPPAATPTVQAPPASAPSPPAEQVASPATVPPRGPDPAPAGRGAGPAPLQAAPPAPATVERAAAPSIAPSAAEAGSRPQRLVIRATEPTWIRVQIGGGRTVEELLPAGASREWMSETRFVLTVGNAGGIEIELNGRPMPSLGPKGVVVRGVSLPPATSPSGS